jgi:hypothetical protein
METTLHRQLKELYATDGGLIEQRLGRYRIDVVAGERLVEIQLGSLAAIRSKVATLVKKHDVLVVRPIVVRKQLVKRSRAGGRVVSNRCSPKRGKLLDVFDELMHFTRVFPHRRLTLEVPLVEIEEWRYPGHGRRRWRRPGNFVVEDQRLVELHEVHVFRTTADLCRLLPRKLPKPFHTGQIAEGLDVPRWLAQRIAYTLREMQAIRTVGKQRGAWLYERSKRKAAA